MSWCGEPPSQMSCNSVPRVGGLESNRRIWAMGIMANKFTRCAYQQLVICLTPTEHLFVPDGPLASCMCVCVRALLWLNWKPLFMCKSHTGPRASSLAPKLENDKLRPRLPTLTYPHLADKQKVRLKSKLLFVFTLQYRLYNLGGSAKKKRNLNRPQVSQSAVTATHESPNAVSAPANSSVWTMC